MGKHGKASTSENGQLREFFGAVVRCLPDLEGMVMQDWIDNPQALRKVLRGALMPLRKEAVYRLITIGDGRTTDALTWSGMYSDANPNINSQNFPARARKEGAAIEIVLIKGTDFDHDPTPEEVLEEAKRRGLKRPVYEDGLYFGVEHRGIEQEGPVVFLHKPWSSSKVLAIYSFGSGRRLDLFCEKKLHRDYRFAFVRPVEENE